MWEWIRQHKVRFPQELRMADVSRSADCVDAVARIVERFTGELHVAALELRNGGQLLVNADDVVPTASAIKIPILIEVYRQVREGLLSLDERLELGSHERVGGSGILKELSAGVQLTIADLTTLMIVLSDNMATNVLIDRIGGVDPVNAAMRSLGLDSIVLHNRIDFDAIGDDTRRFGEASPFDLARLVEGLIRRRVIDAEISEAVLAVMRRQQYLDQVPRYLDLNPYASELGVQRPLEVASKTGFSPGTRVDVGALFLPDDVTIAYCVASSGSDDSSFAPENEAAVVNGLVGRELVRRWWPRGSGPPPLLPTAYQLLEVA
jgi:beta-lactamase class A